MTALRHFLGGGWTALALAITVHASTPPPESIPGYHLFPRDLVRVSVFGEPDLNVDRRIAAAGTISLPLIGTVEIRGLTVAEAEERIRHLFIDQEIFVRPQVSVSVVEYFPKEVSVLGQVRNPGNISFPIEAEKMAITEVISKAGGLTRIARSYSVRVTRKTDEGAEHSFTVDVEQLFDGRGRAEPFQVLPGDVVFVPESVF